MTEIYLIRHSQAQGNRYRMMQGFWDGEVTEMGKKQIEALTRRFSEIPVDAVYSSDLSRAVLTAEAAARRDKLPIETRPALRELNIGPWEQGFFGNICYEEPELARQFMEDAENWRLEGAETFGEVRTRALAELEKIARENEEPRSYDPLYHVGNHRDPAFRCPAPAHIQKHRSDKAAVGRRAVSCGIHERHLPSAAGCTEQLEYSGRSERCSL